MKTICFSSIKGGTGKSSLCILTANYAAAAGYRVLVADLDLQNSLTSYYLDSPEPAERWNLASALHTERIPENIVESCREGVDILASSLDLVKLRAIGERTLKRMIDDVTLPYDFLFVDAPPTYDNLVLNALHAADLVLTPVAFTQFDLTRARSSTGPRSSGIPTSSPPGASSSTSIGRPGPTTPTPCGTSTRPCSATTSATPSLPSASPRAPYVRRSIDTGEKITTSAAKAPLYAAITALASYCGVDRPAGRF